MSKITKSLFAISTALLLIGCDKETNYSYLVQHPSALKTEADRCESQSNDSDHCKMVIRAANDFMNALEEQQQDPEQFGQKIMQTEAAFAEAKAAVEVAQNEVHALKDKKAPASEVEASEKKLVTAKEDCKNRREQMQLYLGVAGLSSPE